MKDKRILQINSYLIIKHLIKTKWQEFHIKNNDIRIFQYIQNDMFVQVRVPVNKELIDYDQAMYDVIRTVAEVEKKTIEEEIEYFLALDCSNMLKIHFIGNYYEKDLLLKDTIQLYSNIENLLVSIIENILNDKLGYSIKETIRERVSECKIRTSYIDGFMISIIFPSVDFLQLKRFGYVDLSAQNIIDKVISDVSSIKNKIDKESIDLDINTDFCSVLCNLGIQKRGISVEYISENDSVSISDAYYKPIRKIISDCRHKNRKKSSVHNSYLPCNIRKVQKKSINLAKKGKVAKKIQVPILDKDEDKIITEVIKNK